METQLKVSLPGQYNKRYSLHYLIWRRKLVEGEDVKATVEELSGLLEVSTRTIYNWVKEEHDSGRREIDPATRQAMARYFSIAPAQILAANCTTQEDHFL